MPSNDDVAAVTGRKMYGASKLSICMLLPDPYDPDMPARPAIMEIFGKCFPAMGHRVVWIAPSKTVVKGVRQERFNDVPVYVVPRYTGSSVVKKVFSKPLFLWREAQTAAKVLREEKCNIVQVRNGVLEGLLGIYLKRKHRLSFVFQYSFPIAERCLEAKMLGGGAVRRMFGMLQHLLVPYVMRNADLVLPISGWMEERWAVAGIPKSKMMPLPLGVNAQSFSPVVDGEAIRKKYNMGGSAVIYLGALEKLRRLATLVEALALVKQRFAEVRLLMVGDGDDRANLERLVNDLALQDNVIFTGQVPYEQVPRFVSAADVAVSPVPPLDIYRVSSPCKLFEYMGAAKPVVANEEIPEHKHVLEESGGGVLVRFSADAFAGAIIDLLSDRAKAAEIGRRGREWVVRNRTYEKLARDVERAYFRLARK